jgi:ABC-2 type transport system permease protein
MLRYIRLYLHFLKFSFSRSFEYRLDFWFRVGMDCVFYAVQLAFFTLLYRHTDTLGGWNYDQILIFVAAYLLSDAIHMTVFSNNMWWLPVWVNKGDLDYYLLRPVSSLFFLSLRDFAANSFLNLILAMSILLWALARYPETLPFSNVVFFAFLLLNGSVIRYVLHMMFVIPVFWMHTNRGLANAYYSTARLIERPDGIFSPGLQWFLRLAFPILWVVAIPSRVLFDGPSPSVIVQVLCVTTVFFLLMLLFWRRGLRAYASASS